MFWFQAPKFQGNLLRSNRGLREHCWKATSLGATDSFHALQKLTPSHMTAGTGNYHLQTFREPRGFAGAFPVFSHFLMSCLGCHLGGEARDGDAFMAPWTCVSGRNTSRVSASLTDSAPREASPDGCIWGQDLRTPYPAPSGLS